MLPAVFSCRQRGNVIALQSGSIQPAQNLLEFGAQMPGVAAAKAAVTPQQSSNETM